MTQLPDLTLFRPAGAIYTPGGWVALAAADRWLLLHLEPAAPAVRSSWSAMAHASALEDVLDPLLAGGLRAMPEFALAEWDGSRLRMMVRGTGTVRYLSADARPVELLADAGTWLDVVTDDLDPATEVVLSVVGTEPSPVRLPLTAGVTMAGSIVLEPIRPTGRATDGAPPILSVLSPRPVLVGNEPVVAAGQPVVAANRPVSATARQETSAELAEPAVATGADSAAVVIPSASSEDRPVEPQPARSVPPLASAGTEPEPPGDFDHLFLATATPDAVRRLRRDIPELLNDRASEPLPEPDAGQPAPVPVLDAAAVPKPNPAHQTRQWSTRPSRNTDDVITSVPWMQEPAEHPAVEPPPALRPKPVDRPSAGQRMSASEQPPNSRAQQTVKRSSLDLPGASSVPLVLAAFCPSEHPNPSHAVRCRTCQQPIAAQEAREIPRPALGVLRLSTGEKLLLDRRVLIGREPPMPDVNEADRPHVLRLTALGLQVSRNHVEVKIDGWRVYVEDLGSTNGTFVTPPDQPTVRLDEHDPRLIEPGTEVRLSDDFSFVYEVAS